MNRKAFFKSSHLILSLCGFLLLISAVSNANASTIYLTSCNQLNSLPNTPGDDYVINVALSCPDMITPNVPITIGPQGSLTMVSTTTPNPTTGSLGLGSVVLDGNTTTLGGTTASGTITLGETTATPGTVTPGGVVRPVTTTPSSTRTGSVFTNQTGIKITVPSTPIPSQVQVKIVAFMKDNAMSYNFNDDNVLLGINLSNNLDYAIEPDTLIYDLYFRENNPAIHQSQNPVYVGSGNFSIFNFPINNKLTMAVPSGASADIGGGEIFSSLSVIGNLNLPNIQSTPHPQGIYTVRIRFTGHSTVQPRKTVVGETYAIFGINSKKTN